MASTPIINRIALQQVKHTIVPGRGTACFEALVLFDGKPVFLASNDGRGGADLYSPLPGRSPAEFSAAMKQVTDWLATLPPVEYPSGSIARNIEIVIGEAMERHLVLKKHRRDCQTKVVLTLEGRTGVFTLDKPRGGKLIESELREFYKTVLMNYPGATIINDLSDDEALAIYQREYVDRQRTKKAA